ncbi:MAG: HDOD domain-containing protein [Spirochaetota bacterium]
MPAKVDQDQIIRAARSSQPIAVKTYTLSHETEVYLEEILGVFLKEFGQAQIKDQIAYCMRELAVNAKKANTKRVYFLEKNLNIADKKDYDQGMKTFKQETLENINYYLDKQKEMGLYIKIVFHAKARTLRLSIHNNVEISKKEQMRIYDRIARSRAFESMEEAFSSVLDDSEGAGLGLVILVLMLKKLGLDEEAFDIDVQEGETVASLVIPFSDIHVESLSILSKRIVDEIDELPQFPDNIVYLQKLISDPDSELTDIARQISMDPSLTADLLKVVNSAQFMLPKRVDNIVEAVKLVGLRGLRNLLYSYGTQKLLSGKQEELWDHSYRAAFYAYNLAKNLRKKDILDDAYVGGILHDMGKIIFSSVHPNLLEKINTFCQEREIHRNFLEDLSAGLNHAEIGGLIAEKWNFPDSLIQAIRYHHEPSDCLNEYKDVVDTVYLANALCNIETEHLSYELLEKPSLETFGIKSAEQFNVIRKRLEDAFAKELAREKTQ